MFTESELKKHLSSGQLKSIYMAFGEEKMLVKRTVELIEKKVTGGDVNDFNYHVFDDNADISEISVCVDIVPFMGGYNVVKLKDINFDNMKKDDFESMMNILKNVPDTTVIIIAMPTLELTLKSAKSQSKKLITYVDKNGVCVELSHRSGLALERDLCKWAKAGGCTMSELTAHTLIRYVGEDLNKLNTELKKLTAYAGGGEITPEMIELLVPKTTEASIYDLFGFVVGGNTDRALNALSVLFYQQTSGTYICTVLSWAYIDAYRARVGVESGKTNANVASDFSYRNRDWVLGKALRQTSSVTTSALRRSLDAILEVQTRLVTETVDEQVEVESLICKLVLIAEDHSDE